MNFEIYPGYYANLRKYLAGGCTPIGISVGTPEYLKGNPIITYMRRLAPSYALLRVEDEAEYTRRFKAEVLGCLDYRHIVNEICAKATAMGRSKAILLCYEKPPKFCHRSLVAEWLNSKGEFYVREYGYEGVQCVPASQRPKEPEQPDLFEAAGVRIPGYLGPGERRGTSNG